MKYSELTNFQPIEDVIQLKTAEDVEKSREYVKNYVMSDSMAENLKFALIEQLKLEGTVGNKGVFIVGNYGTGKSHLMSVISAVAFDAENLNFLQNKNFAEFIQPIAGNFEILRIEIGGVTMPLREILFEFIREDFEKRGINFELPNFNKIKDNKEIIREMMEIFGEKYPDKGYLIAVDEFFSYLSSRNEREIVLDLEFLRAMGEMCSKTNVRIIFGIQEKIFDNPRFAFVSSTLQHISDRFTQVIITKDDTAHVVSERILKKTSAQKALIRAHLEKFCHLYSGMSSRLEEFVNLFPIHPAYIDVFNKIYLIENRHILKNISLAIRKIFDSEVPENAPGIISFDDYWSAIKNNGLLRSNPLISPILNAGNKLEDILNQSFQKVAYKPTAIKIIYALCIHRLTTGGLDIKAGLTSENLKDDLCLYLPLPVQDSAFLSGVVKTILSNIMTTVSGQFITFNELNNQYYIDTEKTVDYDEKIQQRADLLSDGELNRYFFKIVYGAANWQSKEYVSGFEIYQYSINWSSHDIYREGYLFLGSPTDRSTAQPERDFYIYFLPPYGKKFDKFPDNEDEVFFIFKAAENFRKDIALFAATDILEKSSTGKEKNVYGDKAEFLRKKLVKRLEGEKNLSFELVYRREKIQLFKVKRAQINSADSFGDVIEKCASALLDEYFEKIYPEFPKMKIKVTEDNFKNLIREAYNYFGGAKTQQATKMLQSFNLLDAGGNIKPEKSLYADYYMKLLKNLPAQGVINYSEIFDYVNQDLNIDKKFKIPHFFTPIIFLALVYAGHAEIKLENGTTITAANLDKIKTVSPTDLWEFKVLTKPVGVPLVELTKLFEVLEINSVLIKNEAERDKGVELLLDKAKNLCGLAVRGESKLMTFDLWNESLVSANKIQEMKIACKKIRDEFGNYSTRFNTPAKLVNFTLTETEIDSLAEKIRLLKLIPEYLEFKNGCSDKISYIMQIEDTEFLKDKISAAKESFRKIRDEIFSGTSGDSAAQKVCELLEPIKAEYIKFYFGEHNKRRLSHQETKRKNELLDSRTIHNLEKLRGLEILSGAKFDEIKRDLNGLKTCYELIPDDLQTKPICPHCQYKISDGEKIVSGRLENLEECAKNLLADWEKILLETLSDSTVAEQKKYLSKSDAEIVEEFISSKKLPEQIDGNFLAAIRAVLKNYEPIIIDSDELIKNLENLPPMDEKSFRAKFDEFISAYTSGKNFSTLRIIVKRKD